MNKKLRAVSGLALLIGAICQAQASSIQRIDENSLRITTFNGKPPHSRVIVHQDKNPELYARYVREMNETPPMIAGSGRRVPGKSLPTTTHLVNASSGETASFARLEEGAEENRNGRLWRGAPGKGRAIHR